MKVYVRHGEGELMFPSFKEFMSMYRLKFVAPDDLVRRENSDRWVRAGDMPELRGIRDNQRMERHVSAAVWLAVGFFAFALIIKLFTSTHAPLLQTPPHP
jgi:hypothetical protein